MRMTKLKVALIVLLVIAQALGSMSCKSGSAYAGPKLVVVIIVDQFRYDFIERFKGVFGPRGFRRLVDEGAFFTNANYSYVPTYTAPGHAAILAGSGPAQNGIVGNTWYDRDARKERTMVADESAKLVTNYGRQSNTKSTKPASPRILIGTTIGDQMRLSDGFRSKVVAVSFKDRAAVLPGGKTANGAYWFDSSSGTFISSDYYFNDLPTWVTKFNVEQSPDRFFGKVWDRALDAKAYQLTQSVSPKVDDSLLGRHFPYTIDGGASKPGEDFYKQFVYSPFASEHLADFAKAAIEGESLGSDELPDFLTVSFSTPDIVGHTYGPDSEEIEDIYIRLDRVIADFLDYIDRKVGLANTVIAVTADHGVSPVPQFLNLNKVDAGTINPSKCIDAVNKALAARFGGEEWVLDLVNEQLYLDHNLMAEKKADHSEVERIAGEAAMTMPAITNFFTRTQIMNGQMPSNPIANRISNGFNPVRSGDVWLITKPFYFFSDDGGSGTTHGSPFNYDTHVPMILFGQGIHPNRYNLECSPTDIAPTLAVLLAIEPPANCVGRVLAEALEPTTR